MVAGAIFSEDRFLPILALGREMTIRYSQAYQERDVEAEISAMDKREVDPAPTHSATVTLDGLPDMVEALRTPTNQAKVPTRPS